MILVPERSSQDSVRVDFGYSYRLLSVDDFQTRVIKEVGNEK